MAKGIGPPAVLSRRRPGLRSGSSNAEPWSETSLVPGVISDNLAGGLDPSFVQILELPHGNELPLELTRARGDPAAPHPVLSTVGPGDCASRPRPGVPTEDLRLTTREVSLAQDGRRTGFGRGCDVTFRARYRVESCSSSDEAKASESGVDLRRPNFAFSSNNDALAPGGNCGNLWSLPAMPVGVAMCAPTLEAIVKALC